MKETIFIYKLNSVGKSQPYLKNLESQPYLKNFKSEFENGRIKSDFFAPQDMGNGYNSTRTTTTQ